MRRRKSRKNQRIPAVLLLALVCGIGLFVFSMFHETKAEAAPSVSPTTNATITINRQINSKEYTYINKTKGDIHRGELVLINSENEYQFEDENILQSVYDFKNRSYKVKDKDVKLCETVIAHLNDLLGDFETESGDHTVNVISGYRTRPHQQRLLDQKITQTDTATAAMWVAKPGFSEHHSGLAFDFGIYNDDGTSFEYTGTKRYAWINQNCHKYGFIVRYQESKKDITKIAYEPWHFRYVGIPHAYIIAENNYCYEEYIDYIKGFEFSKQHLAVKVDGKSYEIYYTNQTKLPVPKKGDYTVSGNNVDGFIITIKK